MGLVRLPAARAVASPDDAVAFMVLGPFE
jgi:hypothetical protein